MAALPVLSSNEALPLSSRWTWRVERPDCPPSLATCPFSTESVSALPLQFNAVTATLNVFDSYGPSRDFSHGQGLVTVS